MWQAKPSQLATTVHLVAALNELDGNLFTGGDILGQLYKSKGTSVQVCDLQAVISPML